jgi:hypothetical protein
MTAQEHAAYTRELWLAGQTDKAYHWYAAIDPWVVSLIMSQEAWEAAMTESILRQIATASVGYVANN